MTSRKREIEKGRDRGGEKDDTKKEREKKG